MSDTMIGTRGLLEMDGLIVAVEILELRKNFGRTDALVSPVAGEGQRWVDLERIMYSGKRG